jgi:hypothetical protein
MLFLMAMPAGVRWKLIVVSICVFLVINSVDIPGGSLCIFFGKVSVQVFCPFLNG